MLGLRDNVTLAVTKLNTRRVRLMVTLVVSGLLFAVLVAGSLIANGAVASLQSFTKDGFGNRFMVAVTGGFDSSVTSDPAVIKRTQELEKARIAKKTAEAKRLGVPYDPSSEEPATSLGGPEGPKQVTVNVAHPAAQQALRELHPKVNLASLVAAVAKGYGLTATYTGTNFIGSGGNDFELSPIVGGKETPIAQVMGASQDPIVGFAYSATTSDNSLLRPFLLQDVSLTTAPGQPVPILAPVDAVEKLVGLKSLSSKATAQERLARLKAIRGKARNLVFDVCYRNATALDLRRQADSQAADAAANAGKADYVAPKVQYANSQVPCASTVVAKDTRTAAEKQLDAKQEQFKEEFGTPAPQSVVVKFRVAGILPQLAYGASAQDFAGLASSIMTSTLGSGWYMSDQAARQDPVLSKLIAAHEQDANSLDMVVAEFKDRASQKKFMDERNCQADLSVCLKTGKFYIMPYGNPLAVLYDLQKGMAQTEQIALLIVALLTATIMMGTVGRVIADSRKETSVFRAVGAKRLDIAQVYLLYAGALATLAFLAAFVIGLAAAMFVEAHYSPGMSVQAVLAFNSPDANKAFHLIGFNAFSILGIYGFALVCGLVSAVFPLLTNLRRNPIKDMREE